MTYVNEVIDSDKALEISANNELKIFFNSPLKSLKRFFYYYDDPNVEKIVSVDFSVFDSSSLESIDSAFSGCSSLESIDLSNFEAPLLTNMNNAFFHCSSLKSIDLSSIKSSLITSTNRMLCGCNSLKFLNLANIDMSNVEDASYMFYNIKDLKYLNIFGIIENEVIQNELTGQYGFNNINNIIICQNKQIITNPNARYLCFNYDINNDCECLNNILIYYGKAVNYTYGFRYNEKGEEIESRLGISYIYINDKIYKVDELLNIEENSYVKLCFLNNVTSLEKFFDSSIDSNTKYINLIDFSNFDSSSLSNMNSIFSGCSGLVALCNLKVWGIETVTYMFQDTENLKYIKLNDINSESIPETVTEMLNNELNNKNVIVCQNQKIITNSNLKYICCDFDIEKKKCQNNNYIKIKYNNAGNYRNGFGNSIRPNISFIYKGDTMFQTDEPFSFEKNDIIEVH